jgi:hypothetical protein
VWRSTRTRPSGAQQRPGEREVAPGPVAQHDREGPPVRQQEGRGDTRQQLKAWDALAARALAGDSGADVRVPPKRRPHGQSGHSLQRSGAGSQRHLQGVTGRSFDLPTRAAGPHVVLVDQEPGRHEHPRRAAQSGAIEQRRSGTDYLDEAKKIDGYRASDYWSTPHEMGARAFESYIFDKIAGATKPEPVPRARGREQVLRSCST